MGDALTLKVRKAVFAILQDDKNQVLLVANRRSQGGYRWSFPGGLVDEGETSLEALTREVKEETSIHVTEWDHPVNFTYRVDGRGEERMIRRIT